MATVFVSVFGAIVEYEFHSTAVYITALLASTLVKGLARLAGLAAFVLGILSLHSNQSVFTINTQREILQAFSNGGDIAILGVGLMTGGSILAFVIVEGIWRLSSR